MAKGLEPGDVVRVPVSFINVVVEKQRKAQIAQRARLVRGFKKAMREGGTSNVKDMGPEILAGFLLAVEPPTKALERLYGDPLYEGYERKPEVAKALISVLTDQY